MSFASDITDKRQLYATGTCTCCAKTTTYEQRLRLRRACIVSSALTPYVVESVSVDASGNGYFVGDYLQISLDSAPLLVQVTTTDADGGVLAVTALNAPMIQTVPVNPFSPTNVSGSGSGASVSVYVIPNPAICCTC